MWWLGGGGGFVVWLNVCGVYEYCGISVPMSCVSESRLVLVYCLGLCS